MPARLPGPRSPREKAAVAVAMLRNPGEAYRALHARYGEVVGFVGYVGLFGPAANRFVLHDRRDCFAWGPAMEFLSVVVGDTALVVTDGDEHDRRRRLVQPAFATRAVRSCVDLVVDDVDRVIDAWRPGQVVDAYEQLRVAIRRVAVRSLFGDSLGDRAAELGEALADALAFVNRLPPAQLRIDVPGSAWRRARRGRDRADATIAAEVARRRAGATGDDLLDALLPELDDREVRDQVVSLVAAGYDTTSGAAGWLVHELLAAPGAWERAAADASYRSRAVREVLRLWPAGAASARTCVTAVEFAGHPIEPGDQVLYSPYVTQRLASLYPDPDRFQPDRWLTPPEDPYAFVTFGGGARRCIGFALATQELEVIAERLTTRTQLEPLRPVATPTGLAALRPKGGVPVRVLSVRP